MSLFWGWMGINWENVEVIVNKNIRENIKRGYRFAVSQIRGSGAVSTVFFNCKFASRRA